jgi:lambda family phage portal protein
VLAPGDEVKFNAPQDVGAQFEAFVKNYKRDIAAAAGITYEQLTGDMSGVNYSSARVRLIDIRRGFEMDQRNVIVRQFCKPTAAWWLDAAVASGRLRLPNYARDRYKYLPVWIPQPFEHVNPIDELNTDIASVRAGFRSHAEVAMEWGAEPSSHYAELARHNAQVDSLGLVLDTDPRKVARSGAVQATPPSDAAPKQEPPR